MPPNPTPPDSPVTEPLKQTPTYSLDEIEQMLSAVTPGPWTFSAHERNARTGDWDNFEDEHGVYPPIGCSGPVCETSGEANARFIAASPTIVREFIDGYRALLADRAALSDRVAELERENEKLRGRVLFLSQFAKPDAAASR